MINLSEFSGIIREETLNKEVCSIIRNLIETAIPFHSFFSCVGVALLIRCYSLLQQLDAHCCFLLSGLRDL